jgi:hypothetical protein
MRIKETTAIVHAQRLQEWDRAEKHRRDGNQLLVVRQITDNQSVGTLWIDDIQRDKLGEPDKLVGVLIQNDLTEEVPRQVAACQIKS